jgi:superfamily II DNA or RNA helicase
MELFSFQQKFLRVIQESFKEQILEPLAKVLMVLATGLGKTIIAAFWAKDELTSNPKQKILFLCHENDILDQTYDYFLKIIDGQTVMRKFYGQGESKDFLADNAQVVFGSFQTFAKWRWGFDKDHFDKLIVDESHHGQAETYKEVIEYFQVKKRLGMTATPDRMDLKDIRELFGPEVISCDLIEAIINEWLTPFEYHVLNDHISTRKLKKILVAVLKRKEKVSVKQLNETIFIEKRDEEIVKKIAEYNENFQKKTIIFCENIDHLREFRKSLPEGLEFHSLNYTNSENLQMFRDGKEKTILSVNKFNEGIDVPDVEVIVFLRATDSSTIFFQQLGRGLRKLPGKEKVLVLDFVANIDRLLLISSFFERIKGQKGIEFSKRLFKITGDDFSYVFEDKTFENIFDIIRCILAKTYVSDIPHLVEEYSEKNELPAKQVIAGTKMKLWWKCKTCGHEWQASGDNRIRGTGCPACARYVITEINNLTMTHPHLAKEYSERNELSANQVIAGTKMKLWWKCGTCGYEWQAKGSSRTGSGKVKGSGCPACSGRVPTDKNNMAVTHPHLAKEYSKRNKLPANKVIAGSEEKFWWKCKTCRHEWQARGKNRIQGKGCPNYLNHSK